MKLGRITPVDVRTIWTNEAIHFTPWLADTENLKLLGEACAALAADRPGHQSVEVGAREARGIRVLLQRLERPGRGTALIGDTQPPEQSEPDQLISGSP